MQYVLGLRRVGCEVYWLEHFRATGDERRDTALLDVFVARMRRYGLAGKAILYAVAAPSGKRRYIRVSQRDAESIFERADLLLNFHYAIDPELLSRFRRTALVDIDPGLLQLWMTKGQLSVPHHDLYFTTGETVGTPLARFPDAGRPWIRIRPPVSLEQWPYRYDPRCEAFTTVSSWWGGEFVSDESEVYDNNKRASLLEFVALPRVTSQPLELALLLGPGDEGDQAVLEEHGWRVRRASYVSRTPEMYGRYIRRSRGEFSCAKPSCLKLQNRWVSDRTVCYLASGKPVVVQDTGRSSFLPNGEGIFHFSTLDEAVESFTQINSDYERHCRCARAIAEAYFDAAKVAREILNGAEME